MAERKSRPITGAKSETRDARGLRRVLIPTDFSTLSEAAIASAVPLLTSLGAAFHLVHVSDPGAAIGGIVPAPLLKPEFEINRLSRARLRAFAKALSLPLRRDGTHLREGRPFEEICEVARELQTDLIVLPTHGWTGLKHLLIGSTAERVVRHSPCPVLVVRAPRQKAKRAALALRKILVPVDFSKLSGAGLDYAIALARRFAAKLVVFHSVDVHYYCTSPEYMVTDFPELLHEMENIMRERMSDLVRDTDWRGVPVETVIESGHPGDRIATTATKLNADLIVTATHGHSGLKHVFLGSTAEYVVRHATCPVLVVPSHDRERRRGRKS